MALQINTGLTTADGGTVASGSHVKMELYFPMEEDSYNASLRIWRSQQAYTDGLASFRPVEIPNLNYNKELTPAEMSGLTPTIVHQDIKAYLENYVGTGNVSIVE